jgi:phospholipase D1/2
VTPALLAPGRNCWQVARAGRVAFLVDGAAYFAAFAAAAERAERSILLVGWDVHGGIRLHRDGQPRGPLPDTLAPFLQALVDRRPALRVHVLDWDFAVLYAAEREMLPRLRRAWRAHPRLRLRLDGRHPLAGSHHQKIAVVDDAVAFVGGLDLAACRWDTRAHAAGDPRRRDPGFARYPPFHDVQMLVDGAAAAGLGRLVRTRWERATGERLGPAAAGDPWPPDVAADVTDVDVGIARTEPAWDGRPAVREVERLMLDVIASARHALYAEAQYLTSSHIADALAARLQENTGPDIVLVVPHACSGWMEECTMGVLRTRMLERLRAADRHRRLGVYHPVVPGLRDGRHVNVHSKILVADDTLLRVGSANLSNRSLGLDTECDLALEARGEARVRTAIRALRDGLLAEHLGVEPGRVAAAVQARGLRGAVEALRGGERTLVRLEPRRDPWLDELVPEDTVVDPDGPPEATRVVRQVLLGPAGRRVGSYAAGALAALATLVAFVVLWRVTPLGAVMGQALAWIGGVRGGFLPAAATLTVFVAAALLMVPVSALVIATVVAFGPLEGGVLALVGAIATAAAGWGLGRLGALAAVRGPHAPRRGRLVRVVARRAFRGVASGRAAAFAPFAVVALHAGASRARLDRFLARLCVPLVPAVAAISIATHQFLRTVRAPGPGTVLASVVLLLALVAATVFLRHGLVPRVAGGGGD